MALTSQGFVLSVQLVDNGANVTTKEYNLDSANYADAVTDAATVLAALDPVTLAVVKSYSIRESYTEDALTLPGVAVQIENKARIVIGIDGEPNKKWTHDIPAPNTSLFIDISGPGANIVDTAEASLVTYMELFEATGPVTVSDGERVEAPILSGKRVHSRSNRG